MLLKPYKKDDKFCDRIVVVVVQICESTSHHWTVFLQMVKIANFVMCILPQ